MYMEIREKRFDIVFLGRCPAHPQCVTAESRNNEEATNIRSVHAKQVYALLDRERRSAMLVLPFTLLIDVTSDGLLLPQYSIHSILIAVLRVTD